MLLAGHTLSSEGKPGSLLSLHSYLLVGVGQGGGIVQCKSMRENSKHFVFLERKIFTKKILIKEKEPPGVLFYTKASALRDMESEQRLGTY